MQIDHVYTWVNPHDAALNKLRASYAGTQVTDDAEYITGPARTRDNGELRASLQTAAKFMPFIRNTYIIGAGVAPDWLAEFEGRVIYVDQNELIPPQYTPLFQSDAVEAFIYRTPGLSEHYVYSNDDYFFAQPHQATDLFDEQGRALVSLARWPVAIAPQATYRASEENSLRALRKRMQLPAFTSGLPPILRDKRLRAHRRAFLDWQSLARRGLPRVNVIGHVSQPYLKSEWEAFHDTFRTELKVLFANRFRSERSIPVNMMYLHFLRESGKAKFHLGAHDRLLNRYKSINEREKLRRDLLTPGSRIMRFCLNDAPVPTEDGWYEYVTALLRDVLARPLN